MLDEPAVVAALDCQLLLELVGGGQTQDPKFVGQWNKTQSGYPFIDFPFLRKMQWSQLQPKHGAKALQALLPVQIVPWLHGYR